MPELSPLPMEDREIIREWTPAETTVRAEPCPRWVRVVSDGVTVADSKNVLLVFETKRMPVYYFPVEDVRLDLLTPNGRTRTDPHKGDNVFLTLAGGSRTIENAAWLIDEAAPTPLAGHVAFYWSKMDHWFEEDDEVYVHPRDPYHRVDVLHSSRHIKVVVLGETVAESSRGRLLFETGLPTRYYLPLADVRQELLVPSPTTSQCPYKGVANYYSLKIDNTIAKDLLWYYRFPTPECPKIENLACFFNEQVDAIYVDGVELPKPKTPWSKPPTLLNVAP